MVQPAADVHNDSKQIIHSVHVWTVIGGVAEFQLEGEDHAVHQLAQPAHSRRYRLASNRHTEAGRLSQPAHDMNTRGELSCGQQACEG